SPYQTGSSQRAHQLRAARSFLAGQHSPSDRSIDFHTDSSHRRSCPARRRYQHESEIPGVYRRRIRADVPIELSRSFSAGKSSHQEHDCAGTHSLRIQRSSQPSRNQDGEVDASEIRTSGGPGSRRGYGRAPKPMARYATAKMYAMMAAYERDRRLRKMGKPI